MQEDGRGELGAPQPDSEMVSHFRVKWIVVSVAGNIYNGLDSSSHAFQISKTDVSRVREQDS